LWVGSGKSRHLEFSGVAFHFALDQPFPGVLVATRQLGLVEKIGYSLTSGDGMTEITLGDVEQAQRFRVRYNAPDAPDAAVAVLNAGFEKVLAFLTESWPEGRPRLALVGDEGFCYCRPGAISSRCRTARRSTTTRMWCRCCTNWKCCCRVRCWCARQ